MLKSLRYLHTPIVGTSSKYSLHLTTTPAAAAVNSASLACFRKTSIRFMGGGVEWHGTTIICVRKNGHVVMAGDGQVSMGSSVVKGNAKKVRRIGDNILVGFAGSTADALTLLERLEKKLEEHPGQLMRSCCELAKAWRTDKYLRRLEAVLLVADKDYTFELTGNGDVLEPDKGVMGVGSGGSYALSAALALMDEPHVDAEQVARRAMKIAGDICVYTNHNILVEKIDIAAANAAANAATSSSTGAAGTTDATTQSTLPPTTAAST